MRPILRWAGSKRRIVDRLSTYWEAACPDRYVEPFAGSAALFCSIVPDSAVLGDKNRELIETYEAVRDDPKEVSDALEQWSGDEETYYVVRALPRSELTPEVRAARFLYLNRWCFNGIYRTNKRGEFNVPFGGKRVSPQVSSDELQAFAQALGHVTLTCGDFADTLADADAGDFVYLDPPYSVRGTRVFNDYLSDGFGPADLKRLRTSLEELDAKGCRFLVSYADSEEGRSLAEGFTTESIEVTRNVGGFKARRRRAPEVLIFNFQTEPVS